MGGGSARATGGVRWVGGMLFSSSSQQHVLREAQKQVGKRNMQHNWSQCKTTHHRLVGW